MKLAAQYLLLVILVFLFCVGQLFSFDTWPKVFAYEVPHQPIDFKATLYFGMFALVPALALVAAIVAARSNAWRVKAKFVLRFLALCMVMMMIALGFQIEGEDGFGYLLVAVPFAIIHIVMSFCFAAVVIPAKPKSDRAERTA